MIEVDRLDLKKGIGKRIYDRRKQLGFTQEELAEKAGLNTKHISVIENGNKIIQIDTLVKICHVLETNCDFIIFGRKNQTLDQDIESLLAQCNLDELELIRHTLLVLVKNHK